MEDHSELWDTEYKLEGIPSSNRRRPSNVVVEFVEFVSNKLPTSATILDIGAGQGRNALFLAKLGYQVTALDYSKKAIEALRSTAAAEGLNIHSLNQDVTLPWPIETGSQDCAIDAFCFKHVIEPNGIANYVSEIVRVLKPDGWIMLFLATKNDGYYRNFPEKKQNGPGLIIRDPGNGIRSRLYTENELRSLFSEFSVVFKKLKTATNDMHGSSYERESLILYLRKS